MRLPGVLCCIYCGAPTLRRACSAHRDLLKLDRPYTPRGIIYRPSEHMIHSARKRRR